MSHLVKPEVRRAQACLAENFSSGKSLVIMDEVIHLRLNGVLLQIGANLLLAATPQALQRIEVRTALGQPQQEVQKFLELLRPFARLLQTQQPASAQVQRAEHGPAGVGPGNEHGCGLAATRPTCPQGREEQQVGFVLGQERGGGGQSPYLPQNMAFFSLLPGRESTHNGSASRHTPTLSNAAATWRLKPTPAGDRRPGKLAAGAPSNCWHGNPGAAVPGSGPLPPSPSVPDSTGRDAPVQVAAPRTQGCGRRLIVASSGEHCAG